MFFFENGCVYVFNSEYIDQLYIFHTERFIDFQKWLGVRKGTRSKPRAQGRRAQTSAQVGVRQHVY